jgi:hypothetical protein
VRHPKDASHKGQATVDRCRLVPLLPLTLDYRPNHIPGYVVQHHPPEIPIELATQPALLLKVSQMHLQREIPDYGLLPAALGLDPEIARLVRLMLPFGEIG